MADEIELSVQGEIAFVRLNRPQTGNALKGTMFDALRKVALRMMDLPPRYLVITAEGPDFCVGLEHGGESIATLFDPAVRARDTYRAAELVNRLRSSLEAFARVPCPVIAAVEGRCHGAGLEFALMADFRVAGEGATFALTEGRQGVLPGFGGLGRLSVSLGTWAAMDLALSGRTLDTAEAARLGLVQRQTPAGGAMSGAVDLVHELRRTGGTARLQTLLALRAIQLKMATDLQDIETQAAARTWMSGEFANQVSETSR